MKVEDMKQKLIDLYHKNNINLYHSFVFLKGYIKSYKPIKSTYTVPIDFVVTWVDDSDEKWIKEKEKYSKTNEIAGNNENSVCRYRDWGMFKYWFRAVEKYAPWVRKVHLVTYGHIPAWLDTKNPKLNIVRHDEFMSPEYLPTFSSIPIELNMHKIKELNEHFVYFNDDMFLSKPVTPEDFFINGLPVHCAITEPVRANAVNGSFRHQLFSVTGLINGKFEPQVYMPKYPEKWFSHLYKNDLKYNLRSLKEDYSSGFYFSHLACPFRKSTFEMVWTEFDKYLEETSRHKFREYNDIMHQIFSCWDIVNGQFIPCAKKNLGEMFNLSNPAQLSEVEECFTSQNCNVICLNDNDTVKEFGTIKIKLNEILNSVFPEKSTFEL